MHVIDCYCIRNVWTINLQSNYTQPIYNIRKNSEHMQVSSW